MKLSSVKTCGITLSGKKNGFIYGGEAADGEMALPLIEEIQPDIVLTDIRMPFMDGLALSRILRKNMPWLKIIILTGHDEFDYARQAVSIGVNEYILKPIGCDELLEILNKTAEELKDEKAAREKLSWLDDLQEEKKEYLKTAFLNDLMIGALDAEAVIENASKLNIDIIAPFYSVLVLEADVPSECKSRYSELIKIDSIIRQLNDNNSDIISFKRSIKEHVLLVKGLTKSETGNTSYQIGAGLKAEVEDKTACVVSINIGGVKERVIGIVESYREAVQTKSYSFIFGENKIIGIEDTKLAGLGSPDIMPFERELLEKYLKQGRIEELDDFIEKQMNLLEKMNKSAFVFAFIYFNVLFEVSSFISELEGYPSYILGDHYKDVPDFQGWVGKTDCFRSRIKNIITETVEFRDEKKMSRYSSVILKAKKYIEEKYSRSDLSLDNVAGEVNLSASHFSTVFSQESGSTFIEYLTNIRVGKAKEMLLTTNMKSSEIAFAVGYNDSHYFCHIFKKVTGLSPGQFRSGECADKISE